MLVSDMKTETTDRRRYLRDGIFSQIEDATYRVLRKAEQDAAKIQEALTAGQSPTLSPSGC